jgi:beta-barrel assembly-enhancing protease
VIMTGGIAGLATQEVANIAVPATFMKFSRNFEAQADYLGIQYAYKAGYDPVGMINFFEKISTLEKKKVGYLTRIRYVDHPQTPDRIAKSQHEIATILPPRNEYIVDTSDFQQAKKRLALIMKRRLLKDNKEETPQLRRTVDQKDEQNDDDRPVIKRKPNN